MGGLGSGPRCGPDGLGQYKTPDMPESVRDGLWRPGGAFFQIGLGCVISHHHIEGLCPFLFKFWRETTHPGKNVLYWQQICLFSLWFRITYALKTTSCYLRTTSLPMRMFLWASNLEMSSFHRSGSSIKVINVSPSLTVLLLYYRHARALESSC